MDFQDPKSWGSRWSQDIQAYGHLRPGSPEYNAAMKERGYSSEYMQGLTSLGQRALTQAQNPEFVRSLNSGQAPNFGQLTAGIDPVQAMGGYANSAKALMPYVGKNLMAGITHLNANPFNYFGVGSAAGSSIASGVNDVMRLPSQIQQGALGQLDRNSPLVRQFISNAATTHAQNKINDWTSGMGYFGRGLRGLGNFLLGMGTRLPGYETLTNTLVDWFKPELMSKYFPATKKAYVALPVPYSHYARTVTLDGIEVLTPWTRR
jgi:hypothetical protein